MNMRQTLSTLERNTHNFVKEHTNLSNKVEYLKFKSYVEERNNFRSGSGEMFISLRKLNVYLELLWNILLNEFSISVFLFLFSCIDPRYFSNTVGKELRNTLSQLQKTTHNFVREHDQLANRAEYLRHRDFLEQREKYLTPKKWISNFVK